MSKYHCKHLEAREISTDSSSWMQSIQGRGAGTITQRGRRDARLKNMCIKVRISDDFKGTFVCFFFAVMFHEFWERHLVFISFFPRYFAFVNSGGCGVFFFCIFHFFFWPARTSNYIIYIYFFQWYHIWFRMSIHIKQPESNPFTP